MPSGDLVLRVDSEQTQQELHRQRGWTEALGAGTQLNRPHFTVLVKSVQLDTLDYSNQEVAQGTFTQQNPYLRRSELIHVNREQACQSDPPPKVSTVLIDVGSPQEANLLIQEGLDLGYVHHSVQLFHQDCPQHTQKQPAKCSNCKGDHPAWTSQCPARQKTATQAWEAYLTQPTYFAEDHPFPSLSCQAGKPQIAPKQKAPYTPGEDPPQAQGCPQALDSAGQSQQGALFSFVQPPTLTNEANPEPELQ